MHTGADRCRIDPWYSVEILEPDGNVGHWDCRATSADDAMSKARIALAGTGCEAESASFDKCHLSNRLPGSIGKTYRGLVLVNASRWVYVGGSDAVVRDLEPRLDLVNHSPDGFSWGFKGSGPAQLSLALLADALQDDDRALRLYQHFMLAYIIGLPQDRAWSISDDFITIMAAHVEACLPTGREEAA